MGTEGQNDPKTGEGEGKGDGSGSQGDPKGQQQGGESGQSHMEPEGSGDGKGEGSGKGGDGKGSQEGSQTPKPLTAEDLAKILDERETKQFDRLADSQQKQLANLLKQAGVGQDPKGQGGEGEGKGKGQSSSDEGRSEADRKRLVRDCRSSFRDIVTEQVTFMGNFEREDAMLDGSALIAQAIAEGEDDEEKIGQRTAKAVKERLEARRKGYEARVIAGLKRKGLLVETPGQRPSGGSQPAQDAAFNAGKEKADAMFGKKKTD